VNGMKVPVPAAGHRGIPWRRGRLAYMYNKMEYVWLVADAVLLSLLLKCRCRSALYFCCFAAGSKQSTESSPRNRGSPL